MSRGAVVCVALVLSWQGSTTVMAQEAGSGVSEQFLTEFNDWGGSSDATTLDDAASVAQESIEHIARQPAADPASAHPTAVLGTPADLIDRDDLTPELIDLRDRLRDVVDTRRQNLLNTRDNTPWELMHAIIGHGVNSQVRVGGPTGTPVNSIGYLCYGGVCRGHQLIYLSSGALAVQKGPYVQGHYGQLLAILAQSNLQGDYPLTIGGKKFTIADLVTMEQRGCRSNVELTFKLIALMHYLKSDATWRSDDGGEWSISRLIREELAQPIRGAPCGGAHRLMGLSYAVQKRIKRDEPVDGEFARAQKYIREYQQYTFGLQNDDGSFSTEWFSRRGARKDNARRLQTTGHILEWLVYSLPEQELRDPRVVKAVDYLTTLLAGADKRSWEIGPLGHAIRALDLYDRRAFRTLPEKLQELVHDVRDEAAPSITR